MEEEEKGHNSKTRAFLSKFWSTKVIFERPCIFWRRSGSKRRSGAKMREEINSERCIY